MQKAKVEEMLPLPLKISAAAGELGGFVSFSSVPLLEALHPTCSVNYALLSGKHGVAFAADFNFDQLLSGSGYKAVPASTYHLRFRIICRMNLVFHMSIRCIYAGSPLIPGSSLELDHTINKGKQGEILTQSHIIARGYSGAPLTNYYASGTNNLTAVLLHTEALSLTVSAAPRASGTFLMCHC